MQDRVLVLTATAGVPHAVAEAAARALGEWGVAVGETVRLGPDAVEIGLSSEWPDLDPRDLMQGAAVDANVVAREGRLKRFLIADMDSTIIGVECIDELADFAGLKAEVAAITEAAMAGTLDFEAALVARVALLAGLPETVLQDCYDARVRLNPGARRLVRTMSALGAETALVSGGFSFFADRVAAEAGFDHWHANDLICAEGRLTGGVARPILGRAAKAEALARLTAAAGLAPRDAVAVGDGANDLDMVSASGLGVAYHAKPALAAAADARLDHSDFTAILALQGIPARAWRD